MRDQSPLRLLFVARAYPPTLGGMENLAHQLRLHLDRRTDVDVTPLINTRGKKALPFFLPAAVIRGARVARREQIDAIHLADALLAPVGVLLKRLTGLPVTASVCGLDVTYANPVYQATIPRALNKLDLVMPISQATEAEARLRAGPDLRSQVVPLGINPIPAAHPAAASAFRASIGIGPDEPLLLTVGRLIPRKGAAWFVDEVLPGLPQGAYVVIGQGPQRGRIQRVAAEHGLTSRLRILGRVDDSTLAAAYGAADVFIMPNVHVPGDIEGFGLVALEAAAAGLPVVAADLEGIRQAVQHGRTGQLVPAADSMAWRASLTSLLSRTRDERRTIGASFAVAAKADYSWEATAARYADLLTTLARGEREVVTVAA